MQKVWVLDLSVKHKKRRENVLCKDAPIGLTLSEAKRNATELVKVYLAQFDDTWEESSLSGWQRIFQTYHKHTAFFRKNKKGCKCKLRLEEIQIQG